MCAGSGRTGSQEGNGMNGTTSLSHFPWITGRTRADWPYRCHLQVQHGAGRWNLSITISKPQQDLLVENVPDGLRDLPFGKRLHGKSRDACRPGLVGIDYIAEPRAHDDGHIGS